MAADAGTDDTFRLSIRNAMEELGRLNQEVHAMVEPRALPPAALYAVDLVLEELLTNVIKYAYDDPGEHRIGVELTLRPGEVVVRIEDDGRPFDPLAVPEPDTSQPLEQRQVGGLGIHLVRDVAHSMSYQRLGGKNRLEVFIALEDG